jgi:hypothetical protein
VVLETRRSGSNVPLAPRTHPMLEGRLSHPGFRSRCPWRRSNGQSGEVNLSICMTPRGSPWEQYCRILGRGGVVAQRNDADLPLAGKMSLKYA